MITSLGLPVAMTAGKIVLLSARTLSLHPTEIVITTGGLMVALVGARVMLHRRRRRTSQNASSS